MKALSVWILTCLLFRTAILQEENQQPNPNPNPDVPDQPSPVDKEMNSEKTSENMKILQEQNQQPIRKPNPDVPDQPPPVDKEMNSEKTSENMKEENQQPNPKPNPDVPDQPSPVDKEMNSEKTSENMKEENQQPNPKPNPDVPDQPSPVDKEMNSEKTSENMKPTEETKGKEANNPTPVTNAQPVPEAPAEPKPSEHVPKTNNFVGPLQCLLLGYTRMSCSKVFCPPWRRCIEGRCVCKMPYKCPRQEYRTCTLDGSMYYSTCQANAIACRLNKPVFSHNTRTTCKVEERVSTTLQDIGSKKAVRIKTEKGDLLVCGEGWDMPAANVVCRNSLNAPRGAVKADMINLNLKDTQDKRCMRVRCTGSELSLAECTLYQPQEITSGMKVAGVTCDTDAEDKPKDFRCVNGKYLNKQKTCNGIDDCGDNSDEMCCKKCREEGFHCRSGVCIPPHAVRDGIRDCLGGEDELEENTPPDKSTEPDVFFDPMEEIRKIRSSAESQLQCGVPNRNYVENEKRRRKRLVGGEEALPTQIQWQVGIQDEGSIHCGGVYLGGCWVLTAAHCVRPKPKSFRIKFSLWKKHRRQSTTDTIPVKNIIIHHEYNPQTYANDIALMQLEELNLSDKCMLDNPAVRSVCVPWSTQQFQPNDTCTISGWGRDREGKSASTLKWASVAIISDCQNYYKDRFLTGMECAGDLEGKVDSCQGDSGGPLVCEDESGLSYVWGIVSWGDKCGEPNHPGVYTKVAHYFDWIRFHTGWPAVTKFNQ